MKNLEIKEMNKEERFEFVEDMCKTYAKYLIEDVIDDEIDGCRPWNYEEASIELLRLWIRIFNNMRIMKGYNKLTGNYFYWHYLR